MSAGEPAYATPTPAPVDAAVPDYVRELQQATDYLPEEQQRQLLRAWSVGAAAHAGQTRRSGEPYITHPIAVAAQCAEWKLDVQALMAALLHDAIEDCGVTKPELIERFGAPVAELVDGLTKLVLEPKTGRILGKSGN